MKQSNQSINPTQINQTIKQFGFSLACSQACIAQAHCYIYEKIYIKTINQRINSESIKQSNLNCSRSLLHTWENLYSNNQSDNQAKQLEPLKVTDETNKCKVKTMTPAEENVDCWDQICVFTFCSTIGWRQGKNFSSPESLPSWLQ